MADTSQLENLLPHQRRAIEHVRGLALRVVSGLRDDIIGILERAGLDEAAYDNATNNLRTHARVGLHFHPERLSKSGLSVCEGFLRDGLYRNQFETGLSCGSPSGFAGGERDLWEERLFGGAYHSQGVQAADRPKYGALEIMYHPDGPAPRFGSCYFLLRRTFLFARRLPSAAVTKIMHPSARGRWKPSIQSWILCFHKSIEAKLRSVSIT